MIEIRIPAKEATYKNVGCCERIVNI